MKGSICFVGSSGSGKTQAIEHSIKTHRRSKKVFVLNDLNNLAGSHKNFHSVDWNFNFKALKKSILLCEDIVCLSGPHLKLLATFVNVIRRHQDNTCILVTHALRGNNVYALVQHMNFIIFTWSSSGIVNWNTVASIYKLSNDLVLEGQSFFKDQTKKFHTLIFDTGKITLKIFKPDYTLFKKSASSATSQPVSEASLLESLDTVFRAFENGPVMNAYANFLVKNLNSNLIRKDLSVVFRSSNKEHKVSLVDYVACVTDSSSVASKAIKILHKYILAQCTVPDLFIENQQLRA